MTIDGRPTLTALVAIEKVAEEAFVKVTNENMPTHQDTLPTIALLWRILRKVRAFRAYNQQAFVSHPDPNRRVDEAQVFTANRHTLGCIYMR